ncbi:MAG: transposase [Chthoniobacteraceae bacterium]
MSPTTEQTDTNKVKRRRYDEQFKRDAVALLESGRSATQLARELGVSQWNLRDWKEIFGTGGAAAGLPARSRRAEVPRGPSPMRWNSRTCVANWRPSAGSGTF